MFDHEMRCGDETTAITVSLDVLEEAGPLWERVCSGKFPSQVVVLTDGNVEPLYADRPIQSLRNSGCVVESFVIDPGESSKSVAVVSEIYRFLADRKVGRDALIIALGGGVISDLAGFVAATWMRGVGFAIFPTTLEAAIDASIGGKTGVNLPQGKNLVGAFHQPRFVAVDPGCLQTLSDRDIRAGMAESVKHALISSEEFLSYHEKRADSILVLDPETMQDLILRNIRIKSDIVQRDALEQDDLRIFLNFGHTIGHAIESCCGYSLRHGECVALGMMAACRISVQRAGLDRAGVERVEALLNRLELPTKLVDPIETDAIMAAVATDKKNRARHPRFVLLSAIGRPVVCNDVSDEMIRSAYESLLQ